jgi:hypothetical protein
MSEPVNKELYEKAKRMATEKFTSPTGAYRSMWIVRKYKEIGGTYSGRKSSSKLERWRKEGWIDLNQPNGKGGYERCGHKNTQNNKYPLCRPSKTISKDTPRKYQDINESSIRKANIEKQKIREKGNIRFD